MITKEERLDRLLTISDTWIYNTFQMYADSERGSECMKDVKDRTMSFEMFTNSINRLSEINHKSFQDHIIHLESKLENLK